MKKVKLDDSQQSSTRFQRDRVVRFLNGGPSGVQLSMALYFAVYGNLSFAPLPGSRQARYEALKVLTRARRDQSPMRAGPEEDRGQSCAGIAEPKHSRSSRDKVSHIQSIGDENQKSPREISIRTPGTVIIEENLHPLNGV
jgi:hypothetical protein